MTKSLAVLAWRNLRRNARRNIATGVAIMAGFTAFVMASGYAHRVRNVLERYTIYALRSGHITVMKKDAIDKYAIKPKLWSLSKQDQDQILSAAAGIKSIAKSGLILESQGIAGNGCKTFPFLATGVSVDAERFATDHPELHFWAPHVSKSRHGDPLWSFSGDEAKFAVSSGLARLLGKSKVLREVDSSQRFTVLDCSDPHIKERFSEDANIQLASGTWDGQLNALDGDMVQTFNTGLLETNNVSITLPIHHLQSLLATDHASRIIFWLDHESKTLDVIAELKKNLGPLSESYDVMPWHHEAIGPYYTGTMRFIHTMVAFIGLVLAMVIVLSIFNAATMTVIERSEEVGMLRSLGYNQRLIRQLFALEGFYLTLISTVAGIIMGIISIAVVNRLDLKFTPPGVEGGLHLIITMDGVTMFWATLCVSSLGVIATWFAVIGISRKNIAELIAGSHRS